MRLMYDEIDDDIMKLVRDAKEIAVLGLSAHAYKASYQVSQYLQDMGYRIIPVTTNQHADRILEEKVYRDLMSVPYDYDILCIFRPSHEVPEIVNAYFNAPYQAPLVWFQSGIYDLESFLRIEEAGFKCVMDKCLMVEHQRM